MANTTKRKECFGSIRVQCMNQLIFLCARTSSEFEFEEIQDVFSVLHSDLENSVCKFNYNVRVAQWEKCPKVTDGKGGSSGRKEPCRVE